MNAISFDSHEAAMAYKKNGFTEAQVEALVAIDRQTTAAPDISTLATKSDLLATRSDLTTAINALESKLTAAIETAKFQMLTSVIVAMGGLTAIVLAIAKLVH